jgi:hypothetical protein
MSLLITIGSFLPGLLGKQVSDKIARAVGTVALILLMLSLVGLGKCSYDAALIAKHEAAQRAVVAEKQVEADRVADEATAQQARDLAETQTALEIAQAEATKADPVGAAKPVGPVSQSYYDTLRNKEPK